MRTDRKPFLPLDPDIVDDRLERLARDKGVGKFEKPRRRREGQGRDTRRAYGSARSRQHAGARSQGAAPS